MMKNILLIDVDNENFKYSESQPASQLSHYPIGLLYIASAVKKTFSEIEVKIFHTIVEINPLEKLKKLIEDFKPDLIGMRSLSICQDSYNKIAVLLREWVPNIPILGGGPYPSVSYELLLKKNLADIVVIGEGEITMTEIVKWYKENNILPLDIDGTVVLEGNTVKRNKPRETISDLDSITFPDYSDFSFSKYHNISDHSCQNMSETALICSSRGCPYQCFYCHQLFGKNIRRRSAENVVAEMKEHYDKRGLRNFVFVDDLFNVPPRKAKELLRLMIKELPGIQINFPNGLRADQLDEEIIDLLAEAGTVHMALAIETASPRLQKVVGKLLNIEKAKINIQAASKRFIVRTFFMIGFPTETWEEAMETVALAKELDSISDPMLNIVRIFKGTPLYAQLNPTPEQAIALEQQEQSLYITRLLDKPEFYGDLFDNVPLKSKDIQQIRFMWIKDIVNNPTRILNSHNIIDKHLNYTNMMEFYKVFFNNSHFDDKMLERYLKVRQKVKL